MKRKRNALAACAMALAFCQAVQSQEKIPGKTENAATPVKAVQSRPGLFNEWLRSQSSVFDEWDIGGQFRVRYEAKEDGGSFPNRDFRRNGVDNDNSYLLLREKIHVGYTPRPWISAYVEGRDSSTTGDDRNPNPEADQFDLHQGFIRLGDPKTFPLTAKIGRQELIYGDERLLGNADWGNIPRAFDAAKLRIENISLWVDVFVGRVVLPDNHNFNVVNDYDWLSGLYASTTCLIPKQETQFYILSRNSGAKSPMAQPGVLGALPGARDIYTLGLRIKSLPGQWNGWDYTAELASQLGSINLSVPGAGARRLEHEAFAASFLFGYAWTKAFGSPRLGLEYDFASGDSDPGDGKNETFENLFPTNHKHYGYMDFVGWRNIHNPRLSASIMPAKSLSVALDYHLFWLADTHDYFYPESGPGRGVSGPALAGEPASYGRNAKFNNFVGSEINLDAAWAIRPWAIVRAGYGHFFAGNYVKDSLSRVGGATDADWAYAQATFNF